MKNLPRSMKRIFLGLGLALTANTASAALLVGNTFDGNTPGGVAVFDAGQTTDVNVISQGVTRPGHTLNGGFDALVAGELRTSGTSVANFTRYFGFEIAPVAGGEIDFTDFTYSGSVSLNDGTVGPTKIEFRSSLDGFSAALGTVTDTGGTVDLSGAAFQDVTSDIEFRLFVQIQDFGAGTSPGTTFNLSDFAFNGTAVPEPASMALLATGSLCLIARRRRTA